MTHNGFDNHCVLCPLLRKQRETVQSLKRNGINETQAPNRQAEAIWANAALCSGNHTGDDTPRIFMTSTKKGALHAEPQGNAPPALPPSAAAGCCLLAPASQMGPPALSSAGAAPAAAAFPASSGARPAVGAFPPRRADSRLRSPSSLVRCPGLAGAASRAAQAAAGRGRYHSERDTVRFDAAQVSVPGSGVVLIGGTVNTLAATPFLGEGRRPAREDP